jgi:hypothetical protein
MVSLVLVASVVGARASAKDYEMADLQALDKSSSWEELIVHLKDIPPSKRDGKWQTIAEHAGAGLLGSVKIGEHNPEEVLFVSERILGAYPVLKQSKVFMAKRAETGLQAFKWSYSNYRHSAGDDKWIDKIVEFVEGDDTTPDLALRAGKLIDSRLIPVCGFRLFKIALAKGGAAVCKDGDFQRTVVAAVEEGAWLAEATAIVKDKCWGELKGPLLAELEKNKSDNFRQHACPKLKANNALSKAQVTICDAE